MLLKRAEKEQLVKEMTGKISETKAIILVNYQGLKVKEIQELKKRLREQGIGFQIIKNTLFKIALKDAGISIDESLLDQPIAIVWGDKDEVAPSKLVVTFGKEAEKLQIIGGFIDQKFIDISTITQLAALTGREELYAKLVGSLNSPMYRLVNALQGNLRSLVYILDQYRTQITHG